MTSSQQSSTRAGSKKRLVLGILAFVLITPIVITLLSRQMRAEERTRLVADQPQAPRSQAFGPPPVPQAVPLGEPGRTQRLPAFQYREEQVTVNKPGIDPETGEQRVVTEVIRRFVPVYSPARQLTTNERKSREIAARLRQLQEGDEETREALLQELKSQLAAEFQERHERQAQEIAAAQARIEALQGMHQKRSDLKDDIIERRLNELLGEPDVLEWDAELGAARAGLSSTAVPPHMRSQLEPTRNLYEPTPNLYEPTRNLPTTIRSDQHRALTPGRPVTAPGTRESVPVIRGESRYPSSVERLKSSGPPHDDWRPTAPRETRIDIVNSPSSDIFAIARKLLTARLAMQSATAELEQMLELANRGALPQSEVAKQRLLLKTAAADFAFAEAELEAVQQRLQRESEFAKSQLERAEEIAENAKAQYRAGVQTMGSLLEAESAYAVAQKSRDAIDASLLQLEKALELIKQASTGDDDEGTEAVDELDDRNADREDDEPGEE